MVRPGCCCIGRGLSGSGVAPGLPQVELVELWLIFEPENTFSSQHPVLSRKVASVLRPLCSRKVGSGHCSDPQQQLGIRVDPQPGLDLCRRLLLEV